MESRGNIPSLIAHYAVINNLKQLQKKVKIICILMVEIFCIHQCGTKRF
jgi:hypothetical protein